MDAGLSIKPVAGVAVTDYARPTASATGGLAPTELPPAQTVTPVAGSSAMRNDPVQAANSGDYVTQSVTIDPQTREVIYRMIDSRTRQVIKQVPDETLLRNRAYSQAIANGATPFQAESKADLEV
jgi:hypothetical protein